jgi:hypothetical protein
MSFQKNVSAVVRSAVSFQKAEATALAKKWDRDSREYVAILTRIDAMVADGCSPDTVKKDLYATFKKAIADNPAAESEVKAFRAPFKGFFAEGIFGQGFDWAEYVAGFESQDAWRKAHRKSSGARPDDGSKGKPKTDADRVASMLSTFSGCDDRAAALALFIEGAAPMVEG